MAYGIEVQNEHGYAVDEASLHRAVSCTLDQLDAESDSAVTIVFVNDEEIAAYNRQFRQIDAPTDVLSFPADAPPIEIPDEPPYLGDLIVAYPYATAQAAREGHGVSDSLALLVVHGTLHLLGYDHDTSERRAQMWSAQDAVLRALGISTHIVPSLEHLPDHDDE
jgi:probable rRNA maturation factor